MKCAKCGTELGQKNVCPVCNGTQTADSAKGEVIEVGAIVKDITESSADGGQTTEIQLSEKNRLPVTDEARMQLQHFLDVNQYDWEIAFEREFSERDFDFYCQAYEAAKSLWDVRKFLMDAILATDAEKMTPPFQIQTIKQLQEKYPDFPVPAARKWLSELFSAQQMQKRNFNQFARNFKLPNPEMLGAMIYISPAEVKITTDNSEDQGEKQSEEDVSLLAPVWIQSFVVGPKAWEEIMDEKRETNTMFTWNDAMSFCKKLTAYNRSKNSIPEDYAYSLPDRKMYEFIRQRGYMNEIKNFLTEEWLCDDIDGLDYKPIIRYRGNNNIVFDNRHRESRFPSLGFRVVLAPRRPGVVWDDAEEKDNGSDGNEATIKPAGDI